MSLVTKSCPTLWDPMDHSTLGFLVLHHLPQFAQTYVHWISDAIQPSHALPPFLLLPSIFVSIRVFSNESALCIRWPKYWSFSFSISLSSEYSGLISFRIDCLTSYKYINYAICVCVCVCDNRFCLYSHVCEILRNELEGWFLLLKRKEEVEMGGRWLRRI